MYSPLGMEPEYLFLLKSSIFWDMTIEISEEYVALIFRIACYLLQADLLLV
jgi:hypothetical protein